MLQNKGEQYSIVEDGKRVFDTEIRALQKTREVLDETFEAIVRMIVNCEGKVIISGMGKPGHIASKLAATLSSLGTPSFCLHPAEALHGDLGMISENDIVVAISYSGESDEIVRIMPSIKMIGAKIIAITGKKDSTLAKYADMIQLLPEFEEACYLGLAPTSSTTVELCYGDAIAVVASVLNGFSKSDFGLFHPAGALGKKLIIKVSDIMAGGDDNPYVTSGTLLIDAIALMSRKGLGVVSVVDKKNKLMGLITDGDLRRIIEKRLDLYNVVVDEVMTGNPKACTGDMLAVDALNYIKKGKINNLPVVDGDNELIGTITWQMIIREGIVI